MDWRAYGGGGPALYDSFLVPAVFAPFAEDLLDAVGVRSGESVLDVACGTGAVSRAAARRAGPGGRVVGVDLSSGMLAVARSRAGEAGAAPIEYREAAAEALPVPPLSFDVVLCQQGLQFASNPRAAVRSMGAALAPGGRLAIAVWGLREPPLGWLALADALGRHIDESASTAMLAPFRLADVDALRELVRDAGFAHVEVVEHNRTVRFGVPPQEFARGIVLASPLADTFSAASRARQQAILAEVAEAVKTREGQSYDVRYPMTANVALVRA
jgi:ubiquinone/menaquinone biosynthesis C-methylase UbiE